jgi:DNA-binding CsgD family transcriptional regulator
MSIGSIRHGKHAVTADLVADVYEGIVDPALWHRFLERLCKRSRAQLAMLASYNFASRRARVYSSVDIPKSFLKSYEESYAAYHAWAICAGPLAALHGISAQDLAVTDHPGGAALYTGWLLPLGIRHIVQAVIAGQTTSIPQGNITYLTIGRNEAVGPYSDTDMAQLTSLLPHLDQAIEIYAVICRERVSSQGALRALDMLEVGAILIDQERRILAMNATAQQLLDRSGADRSELNEALSLYNGHDLQYPALPSQHTETPDAPVNSCGITIICGRYGEHPLMIARRTLPSALLSTDLPAPAEIVFLAEADRRTNLDATTIRQLYGLTPAEASVAVLLAQGQHLDEAAEVLKITVNTARTHLKRIFDKTNTERQTDLVRLLLNPCVQVRAQ